MPPLCVAIRFKKHNAIELLRSKGVALDFYSHCFLGNLKEVQHTLNAKPALLNTEVDFDSVWRVTAFHYAVAGGNIEMVNYLASAGAVVRPYSRLLFNILARQKGEEMYDALINAGIDERYARNWYKHQV